MVAEALCLLIAGKPIRLFLMDGSALLTGWLLAMTLPPWAPWWIGVVGALIAIIIGKHVFGGLGQNLLADVAAAGANGPHDPDLAPPNHREEREDVHHVQG